MGQNKIPDGWLDYSNCGVPIPNTPFVAFKTPLNETISKRIPAERIFMPDDVLTAFPKLGLIIDLTFSNRFYKGDYFSSRGVDHVKIKCPGQMVPSERAVARFFSLVDTFLIRNKNNSELVIGVHCTHGLNRTGYFICKYMIQRLKFSPENAINEFQIARGHKIHRQYLLDDLIQCSALIPVLSEHSDHQETANNQPNLRKRNDKRFFPQRSNLSKRGHISTYEESRHPYRRTDSSNWRQRTPNDEQRYFNRRYTRPEMPYRHNFDDYHIDNTSRNYRGGYLSRQTNYPPSRNNSYQSTSRITHHNPDFTVDDDVNNYLWMNY